MWVPVTTTWRVLSLRVGETVEKVLKKAVADSRKGVVLHRRGTNNYSLCKGGRVLIVYCQSALRVIISREIKSNFFSSSKSVKKLRNKTVMQVEMNSIPLVASLPRVVTGEKNSPTVAHACRSPPGWGLEHRASNPLSVKNLTAIETSTIVKLRPYVLVGTKRTSK
jgi:hypothetical protein